MNNSPIIIALDYADEKQAWLLINNLDPKKCRLKVGKGMFTRFGPAFIKKLLGKDFEVFLDLKFHDIPNTIADAVTAAAELGVWMLNVHALGGRRMLETAREALDKLTGHKPILIAVTLLTSHSQRDIEEVGLLGTVEQHVLQLAKLSMQAGLDGVVCSAQEAKVLRENLTDDFLLVTPGIRLETTLNDDQHRIVTPQQALTNGSNYLVIGRPITTASEPMEVIENILQSNKIAKK